MGKEHRRQLVNEDTGVFQQESPRENLKGGSIMAVQTIADKQVEVDAEGYLLHPED